MKKLILILSLMCVVFAQSQVVRIFQENVTDGMEVLQYTPGDISPYGDNIITVLRIDPNVRDLNIMSVNETRDGWKTADDWLEYTDGLAVVNAGMFMSSGTNCGYLQVGDYINQPLVNSSWNMFFACNPKSSYIIPAAIIDRRNQDWQNAIRQYHSCAQSIRMIDNYQNVVWSQQPLMWSMVVACSDKDGNILFAFTRSPYTVHDFSDMLLDTDLNIYNAMYLDGGPEASMSIHCNDVYMDCYGSYETGFNENDDNDYMWAIPNVIYVK